MLAGFAEIEYTPAEGNMPGEIGPYYAKGAHTPLMAHAAVITAGGKTAVLVSLDIIFITVALSERIKQSIGKALGIPTENVLLACTHTHTGCGTDYQCWGTPAEPEMAELVGKAALDAAKQAYETRIEATLGTGKGFETRYSFNRDWYMADGRLRSNPGFKEELLVAPFDTVDQEVHVMRIDSVEENRPRCFIVNYANHPDNHKEKERHSFSADYPGYLRKALQRRFGYDVTVIFLNGTCGDVNDLDFKNKTSDSFRGHGLCPPEQIGEGLAETVAEINKRILPQKEPFINARSELQATARRHATAEMRAWARMILAKKEAGEEILKHSLLLAEQYVSEPEEMPATCEVEVHTMQIGDWAIVGLPGEIYTCIGTRIKANSPFANTLVVELESGANGYISPDIIQDCGAYEGIYSSIAFTGHGTVDVLVNGAARLLGEMHKDYLSETIGGVTMRPVYVSRKN